MKAGVIGIGHLGKAIAERLISQGIELVVWNRTQSRAEELGVRVAESPASLISEVDTVFLCLFDSSAVSSVAKGKHGLLSGDCRNKVIIDTTTNHFDSAVKFHQLFKHAGAYYLEAPVLGSVLPASQGKLTVLVSGEKIAYEEALPYLNKLGERIFFLGRPGLATKMKLVNNLVLGSFMATIAEALSYGEAVGLSREEVLDILASGAGNSMILTAKREKLMKEDFSTQFSASLIYKDLSYIQDLAKSLKKPLFTGSIAKELFAIALSKDMGDQDFSSIYKALKEI